MVASPQQTTWNTETRPQGPDYVTLVATVVLGVIACVALYLGQDTVAGTATGAVAGLVFRLYHA